MDARINEILERIKALQGELEAELGKAGQGIRYRLEGRKIYFEHEILAHQRLFKQNLLNYIATAKPKHLIVAPFIYAVFFPMLALDCFATLYQWVCFPIYGIPRIKRRDHMTHDRHHLAYLNVLEKINCYYCSYGFGLVSYLKEIISRTEQYWCPINHASKLMETHPRYQHFADYGDAETYRNKLESIRKDFED